MNDNWRQETCKMWMWMKGIWEICRTVFIVVMHLGDLCVFAEKG